MSPLADALADTRTDDATFPALLQEIYASKYTGAIVIHVADGIPRVVQFMGRQVRLDTLPTIRVDSEP